MKKRSDVAVEDRWNVESLFSSQTSWKQSVKDLIKDHKEKHNWPMLHSYMGTLNQGPEQLKKALELFLGIDRQISKLYTYAHLRHDEDIANSEYKKDYEKITTLAHSFAEESAWFQPELLSLPESTLSHYLASPLLADYHFFLEKMMRLKKHTLSPENEKLIALAGQSLQTPSKAFSAINDADFKFGEVSDSSGASKPLSHATYALYIRDHDRQLRKNAFNKYCTQYEKYENTLCELLNGQVQSHLFQARSRHYPSCLNAALYPKNIETSVFHALVQAVHDRLNVHHRYMEIRKRVLNLKELHHYDIHVPLTQAVDIRMSYEEAEDLVIESVHPLGVDYQNELRRGLKQGRWVDRYENENKRSGAYSSGCYDSMPYILMNYKGILRDVFTLAHEVGHSMHSFYSCKHQPYHYSDYTIFLAEVASTFNEDLLTRLLIERSQSREEKIFLINQKIEDIRGTLFRQTMFAEFELMIHQYVEEQIPLTPDLLKKEYVKLNQTYFGPALVSDPEIAIEWARIPHFYYNFYVYQYATGISAALALANKVVKGGEKEREAYLSFLKGGSSKYPIDMLKMAGIDMTTPEPIHAAIDYFDRLLTELEELL
jgi:oligoendopeptidase F